MLMSINNKYFYTYTSSSIMLSTILTEHTSVSTSNFLTFTKEGSLYLKELADGAQ